jgi:nucleotide-binding universal stress UspA family protein
MSLILVPLDFSACAPNVLAEAVRFGRAFGARLLLLHASDPPRGLPLTATVQPPDGGAARTVLAVLQDDAVAQLAPMLRAARDAGVEASTRVGFGRVAEVILEVAAAEGATMILMGTHGRTGLARMAYGSVAEDVVRHAEVPVVTVRTRHDAACAARRCATCDAGRSPAEERLLAEDVG